MYIVHILLFYIFSINYFINGIEDEEELEAAHANAMCCLKNLKCCKRATSFPYFKISIFLVNCPNADCDANTGAQSGTRNKTSRDDLQECFQKLLVTLQMTNQGIIDNKNQYIVIDHVTDPVTNKKVLLLNPYVIKIKQEPLKQTYPLTFERMVNGDPQELIMNKDNTENYRGCNLEGPRATCPEIRYRNQIVPFSSGFCCSCDEEKNKQMQPDDNENTASKILTKAIYESKKEPEEFNSPTLNPNQLINDYSNLEIDNSRNQKSRLPVTLQNQNFQEQIRENEAYIPNQQPVPDGNLQSPKNIQSKPSAIYKISNAPVLPPAQIVQCNQPVISSQYTPPVLPNKYRQPIPIKQSVGQSVPVGQSISFVQSVPAAQPSQLAQSLPISQPIPPAQPILPPPPILPNQPKLPLQPVILPQSSPPLQPILSSQILPPGQPNLPQQPIFSGEVDSNFQVVSGGQVYSPMQPNQPITFNQQLAPPDQQMISNQFVQPLQTFQASLENQARLPQSKSIQSQPLYGLNPNAPNFIQRQQNLIPNSYNRPINYNQQFQSSQSRQSIELQSKINQPIPPRFNPQFSQQPIQQINEFTAAIEEPARQMNIAVFPPKPSTEQNLVTYKEQNSPIRQEIDIPEATTNPLPENTTPSFCNKITDTENLCSSTDGPGNPGKAVKAYEAGKPFQPVQPLHSSPGEQIMAVDQSGPMQIIYSPENAKYFESIQPLEITTEVTVRTTTEKKVENITLTDITDLIMTECIGKDIVTEGLTDKLKAKLLPLIKADLLKAKKYGKDPAKIALRLKPKHHRSLQYALNPRYRYDNWRNYHTQQRLLRGGGQSEQYDPRMTIYRYKRDQRNLERMKRFVSSNKGNFWRPDGTIDQQMLPQNVPASSLIPKKRQRRGGQNCDNIVITRDTPESYHESTHCLTFSNLWYSVYNLGSPHIEHKISIQIFQKYFDSQGKSHWKDVARGRPLQLSDDHPISDKKIPNILVTYNSLEDESSIRPAINYQTYKLVIPERRAVDPDEFLIIPTKMFTDDGKTCNKIGVGFEAFYRQQKRCTVDKGSCLANQPKHFRDHVIRAKEAGVKDDYSLKSFGLLPKNAVGRNISGSEQQIRLFYTKKHCSNLYFEIRADYTTLLIPDISASLTEIYVDAMHPDTTRIITKVTNTGLMHSVFYVRLGGCPLNVPASFTNIISKSVVIEPQQQHVFDIIIHSSPPEDDFFCSLYVQNIYQELIAVRRVRFVNGDRCICIWHCECGCYDADEGLKCTPLSPQDYQAAGFQGSLPVETQMLQNSSLDEVIANLFYMFLMLALTLLIMGLMKALLGLCCKEVSIWGLDVVLGIEESDVTCSNETCHYRQQEISLAAQFCLNIIFFFIFPLAMINLGCKTLFGDKVTHVCPCEAEKNYPPYDGEEEEYTSTLDETDDEEYDTDDFRVGNTEREGPQKRGGRKLGGTKSMDDLPEISSEEGEEEEEEERKSDEMYKPKGQQKPPSTKRPATARK